MEMEFDPIADAAYLEISDLDVESSKEIQPGIIADYDEKGQIVGIAILHVGKRAMLPLKQAT